MDIEYVLETLFQDNRIYVSEADFQFAFAWKIKELYPDATIRLEFIPWEYDSSMHIDIVVFHNEEMIPIELKYKTRHAKLNFNGEKILLKAHSAQDCGRYDFLYDIQRMEGIKESCYPVKKAYAVMVTNDSGYWNKSMNSGTSTPPVDDEFRIHEGASISGVRSWKEHTGAGTKKNREKSINIKNVYVVNWKLYQPMADCLFKYSVISI